VLQQHSKHSKRSKIFEDRELVHVICTRERDERGRKRRCRILYLKKKGQTTNGVVK